MSACREHVAENPRVTEAMREYRRQGAKLAAMILVAEPQRLTDMAIGDFLLRIEYIDRKRAEGWLRAANVNPWREGSNLTREQRGAIARELIDFAKGDGA